MEKRNGSDTEIINRPGNSGRSKLTIGDIAETLGVSKTTVSRAISGKGRIGTETKERILSYIKEHEYVPNALAKGLAQSRTNNIGIVVPKDFTLVDLPFFQKCLMGVCECAGAADYDVVVTMTSAEDISQLERLVNNRKVDGVLLTRTFTKDRPAELLKSRGIPFVAIGTSDDPTVIQVDHDHVTACRELTKLLRDKGLSPILLCGDMTHMVTRSRLKGFTEALHETGLTDPESFVKYNADGSNADEVVADAVSERPDCILCMDDSICLRVLDRLKQDGVSVPDEIKVASFYTSSTIERNTPSVTSLKFDDKELGRAACRTLIDMINGKTVPGKTFMGYRLSVKESTGSM